VLEFHELVLEGALFDGRQGGAIFKKIDGA